MKKRVVVTGMGVAAPNAHGLDDFEQALREGRSGIRFIPQLEELKFGCQIAGVPENFEAIRKSYFDREKLLSLNDNIGFASVSAVDAWKDAGFSLPDSDDDIGRLGHGSYCRFRDRRHGYDCPKYRSHG